MIEFVERPTAEPLPCECSERRFAEVSEHIGLKIDLAVQAQTRSIELWMLAMFAPIYAGLIYLILRLRLY